MTLPLTTTSNRECMSNPLKTRALCVGIVLLTFTSCTTTQEANLRVATGNISYPFIGETAPLGRANPKQPFIVKSAVGAREYSVEIPDNGGKFDIQIPLAEISPASSQDLTSSLNPNGRRLNPANTDKELIAALPDLGKTKPNKTNMLDNAFGVGSPEGPSQSPSYTLGIARVNQYFKERNFELALVELNNLLAFYPNSPKLLKMKGTLLVKTGNRELAMRSWQRALDLAPNDTALRNSIGKLNERIIAEQNARAADGLDKGKTAVTPIGPDPDTILDRPAH